VFLFWVRCFFGLGNPIGRVLLILRWSSPCHDLSCHAMTLYDTSFLDDGFAA
jgi:hypothetical protein